MARISLLVSKELQQIVLALKASDATIQKQVRVETKKVVQPAWQEAIGANVHNPLEARVLGNTARASTSNSHGLAQVTLQAGRIGKALSGGGKPPQLAAGAEFGSEYYKQFGPRSPKGNTFYPALAEVIPRIASLWYQTAIRTLLDTFGKK
jgi:hypothetical protein